MLSLHQKKKKNMKLIYMTGLPLHWPWVRIIVVLAKRQENIPNAFMLVLRISICDIMDKI